MKKWKDALRALGGSLALMILVTGCGRSNPVETAEPTERSCDLAPFPSVEWTSCELTNFARTLEAPTEQLDLRFAAAVGARSTEALAEWTARAVADPSWISPLSGNTAVTPVCATGAPVNCVGDPFRHPTADGADGQAFYENEAQVVPVVFYDRDCARLSGRVWVPRNSSGALPGVVITNGSIQASEAAYWWAAQALVRAGYAVLSYDVRGQGRSDLQSPTFDQGTNLNARVFWEGQVDAIDFFRSTPAHPYPQQALCAGTYPTVTESHNPLWARVDRERIGIVGHSLGSIGVSVVQGYGAPGADPWPGLLDDGNPVSAAVGWDSLITPDFQGFAPIDNYPVHDELLDVVAQIATQGNLPRFAPRVPALSFNADYGLVPAPYVLAPNPEDHKDAFGAWQAADVPAMAISIQGTTHVDFFLGPGLPATSWCPDPSAGACRGGWGLPAIVHYTVAWFDRWLKRAGEPGYADADARLIDDSGPEGADKLSFHFRSARDFPDRNGRRQHCEDMRAGC